MRTGNVEFIFLMIIMILNIIPMPICAIFDPDLFYFVILFLLYCPNRDELPNDRFVRYAAVAL